MFQLMADIIVNTFHNLYLPPATKLGQGYIFIGVSDSVHGGRGGVRGQGGVRGRGDVCGRGIRSMSGRHASYWNAFLLVFSSKRFGNASLRVSYQSCLKYIVSVMMSTLE